MTQPTQDTDITSSISPMFHTQEEAFSENLRAGKNVKKLAQGRPPPTSQLIMEAIYSDDRESEFDDTAKSQGSELVKSLGETFPWLIKFSKVIQSAVGSKNPKLLDRLLFVYIENMSRDVNSCYTKPYRAAKLKNHISETLIFFHLYWRNIKERVDDHNQYLDKMSEILGMYVDMELKASRRGKDSASKIVAKLLTAMFIYLDNSEEHIFRILFRVKFITKNYSQICAPIFKKLFTGISGSMKCVSEVTYVRYLLAFKLWKRIKEDLQEKKKINELAVLILGQQTPSMNSELVKIIPKPPECQKNGTLWLLQPNSFDLRKACDGFINYELNERIISLPDSVERLKIVDNYDLPSIQTVDRLHEKSVTQGPKSIDETPQVKKLVKLRRFKPSFPKLRPGEVVFIDLTAENEDKKQEGGKKKKKKDKKKLKWLKEVSKRSKLKKERKVIPDKTWVEKADAHSTEDNLNGIKRTANNWPISEDKVTESTQRIQSTSQNIQRFGKRVIKLSADVSGAKQDKKKCETTCEGCKFCTLSGKIKYTSTKKQENVIESSENLVTSQTSLLNNDAMVFSNGSFIEKESYPIADSFGEAISSDDFLFRNLKQEHNDSGTRSYTNKIEYSKAAIKMIKRQPDDIIIDDSTTDRNCDKIRITDSSSFNISKKEEDDEKDERLKKRNVLLPIDKVNAGDTKPDGTDIPSTSSTKTTSYSLPSNGKLSKVKECVNETCVVSTTASIVDFNFEEQINVISGSTNETLKSNFNPDDNREFWKEEEVRKSFPISKTYKSAETIKNFLKISPGDLINNKLQQSLIHDLSLDEIIQIGRDDVDSQSEDDGDKESCYNKTMRQSSSKDSRNKFYHENDDNEFFQIPDIRLCDDLTNDNEVESLVTAGGKSKVDEFENIDILDSILNGDMSMQDILEEQQNLSMNSVSNETSANNMLGFFTEFFKQSEATMSNKTDSENEETSHINEISKSLPEGSLGMTGILNSLLDSDLTSIDSPPSDFMYSNVQTVDPRLIRKSPTAERAAFLSNFSTVSDLFSQKEQSAGENFTPVDSVSKKTKDQLFLDQKDSLNCTDLEEFGLNSGKETPFEIPALEEELIQLPQHPLIDDTIITPNRSDMVNLNDVKEGVFNGIQLPENNYNFQEFNSFRLKDIIQQSGNEIDQGEDLPTSTLTDFTPPQSVDSPQSPYNFVSSPAPAQNHSQTVPHSPTHTFGISRQKISANMLTPPPNVPQFFQNNLTPPPTPQQNPNPNEAAAVASGNLTKSRISCLSLNPKSSSDDYSLQLDSTQKNEACKIMRRKPQTKVTNLTRGRKNIKDKIFGDEIVVDEEEQQAARLAQVQVALTRLTREEINGKASGEESVLKNRIMVKRAGDIDLKNNSMELTVEKGAQRQLKSSQLQRIDFREFGIATKQNKSVLINLNGKTKPAIVFERNKSNDKIVKNFNEGVNSSRSSNILYKLTSNVKPSTTSKEKPYSKIPKVNFTLQKKERDLIVKQKSNLEISSKDTQAIIRPRCSTRRVNNTQANKTTNNEINVRKTMGVNIGEEPSLKKRKIATKFLPMLENEGIIYAVNQQKVQEKHSNVIRRDFTRKDRTKKKVV